MTGPQLERVSFSTPRTAEYVEAGTLRLLTGVPEHRFGEAVLKELLDNALDACETAGVAPEITVTVTAASGTQDVAWLTVTDNGPGIPPATVDGLCDFTTSTSDKAAYVSPSRGAMGNAWSTIVGIPYALGIRPGTVVVIEACGIRHRIWPELELGHNLVIRHEHRPARDAGGTVVQVPLPACHQLDAAAWVRSYAAVNPHATFTVYLADSEGGAGPETYKPAVHGDWVKWLPTSKTSPWWYSRTSLLRLISAHVAAGIDQPLGEFIREFDGLTGTAKARDIAAGLPQIGLLSDFTAYPEAAAGLLAAMQARSRPPSPGKMGKIPAGHYHAFLDGLYGVDRWWSARKTVLADGIPWAVDVTVAETAEPGAVFYGTNFAATFRDPLGECLLSAAGMTTHGEASWLRRRDCYPEEDNEGLRAAIIHVQCADPPFFDKGKTQLNVPAMVATEFAAAFARATKTLNDERRQTEKDARRDSRRQMAERKRADDSPPSLKDAVRQVLPAAAGTERGGPPGCQGALPILQRNLYYTVRPLVQEITPQTLTYANFTAILTDYENESGDIPGLARDPRGALHEPHTSATVRLGTLEVAGYVPPGWLFNKVLYVEKEGIWPLLEAARLAERHDMAVLVGKGYSVRACRKLLTKLAAQDVVIYVLHDADIDGYEICRTLGEATRSMPGHHVDVADIGLSAGEAIRRRDRSGISRRTVRDRLESQRELSWRDVASTLGRRWAGESGTDIRRLAGQLLRERLDTALNAGGTTGTVVTGDIADHRPAAARAAPARPSDAKEVSVNDDPPLGRCLVPGCPVRFTPAGAPDRLCSEHQDDRTASGAYVGGLSRHRSPWADDRPSEPDAPPGKDRRPPERPDGSGARERPDGSGR